MHGVGPSELRSPAQSDTPEPIRLPSSVPIATSKPMAVLVPPPTIGGKVDGFIDDLINVFIDNPANCARQPHVVPLAMHVTSRLHAGTTRSRYPGDPHCRYPNWLLKADQRKSRPSWD